MPGRQAFAYQMQNHGTDCSELILIMTILSITLTAPPPQIDVSRRKRLLHEASTLTGHDGSDDRYLRPQRVNAHVVVIENY